MLRRTFFSLGAAVYDVTRCGAAGDGKTDDRRAIQRAIDDCASAGGGTVVLPAGRFLSGNLRLKSGVNLQLDRGAVLVASSDPRSYEIRKPTERVPRDGWGSVFLLAENAERVAVSGWGIISGGGLAKPRAPGGPPATFRPRLVAFETCRDVVIEGVTLRDADRWTLHLYHCDSVRVSGVRILTRYDIYNTDGIDVDGCRNVLISDCEIVCGDDCIVIKTTDYLGEPRPTENVTITNCVLSTRAAGFKVGTETNADIRNITVSNCVVYGTQEVRPNSALSLECVDGARLSCVAVCNITAKHVMAPVFVRLGDRRRLASSAGPSRLDHVSIKNVVAEDATLPSSVTGIPGGYAEDVSLCVVLVSTPGSADAELARRSVPEQAKAYPHPAMFGPLPALALYARHVRGLWLSHFDVKATFTALPAFVAEDAPGLAASGLRLNGRGVTIKLRDKT